LCIVLQFIAGKWRGVTFMKYVKDLNIYADIMKEQNVLQIK